MLWVTSSTGTACLPGGDQAGDPWYPSCVGQHPDLAQRGGGGALGSFPSLPLGFRCTNPRGRTLPLQPVRGTSPPPPRRWAQPEARTPLKRRRPPFRVTPATTLDYPPILTSGMCEGSSCPARDWTKCVGNKEKRTCQANCSLLPRKWSFHTDDRIGLHLVNCQDPEGGLLLLYYNYYYFLQAETLD